MSHANKSQKLAGLVMVDPMQVLLRLVLTTRKLTGSLLSVESSIGASICSGSRPLMSLARLMPLAIMANLQARRIGVLSLRIANQSST